MKLYEVLGVVLQQAYSEAAQQVVQHCTPYLKATNYGQEYLWRGMKSEDTFQYKTPRQTRDPLDTHPVIHDAANAFFEMKFGTPLRSQSIFVALDRVAAMRFGDTHLVFPTGASWQLYGSPYVRDFTAYINQTLYNDYLPELYPHKLAKGVWQGDHPPELTEEQIEQTHEAVYSILEQADYKQLQPAALEQFPEKNEIMMVAKGYYAVSAKGGVHAQQLYQLIKDQTNRK